MSMNSVYTSAGSDFVRNLGDAARRHPVSTALIGMGVVWLMTGGRPAATASNLVRRGYDRLPDGAADWIADNTADAKQRVASLGDQLSGVTSGARAMLDKASSTLRDSGATTIDRAAKLTSQVGDVTTDFARAIPARSADLFSTTRDRLNLMLDEQPLLLGAVGLAIGAGIAASLPPTRIEAEYFGERADELKAKAAGFVGEKTQQVQAMAEEALETVAEEAKRQGFSADALKAAASEVGDKISATASAAGGNITSNDTRRG